MPGNKKIQLFQKKFGNIFDKILQNVIFSDYSSCQKLSLILMTNQNDLVEGDSNFSVYQNLSN